MRNSNRTRDSCGMALLAVLWLVAALSAIAFTVASTVRAETERASTEQDALRAYYLAQGAVYRGILWVVWGGNGYANPDGKPLFYKAPMPRIHYDFPTGAADVELIPEKSKLDINRATSDDLVKLLGALGTPPDRAQLISEGIVDWRTPSPAGGATMDDAFYLSLIPPFRARHASFEEIEELLLVRGMTPEIFYGGLANGPDGHLVSYGGLKDCVSIYGSINEFDVNTANPAILSMIGMHGDAIQRLLQMRGSHTIESLDQAGPLLAGANGKVAIGGGTIWTVRATARFREPDGRLSDIKRTLSAMVKFLSSQWDPPYHVMRWYDNVGSPAEMLPPAPTPPVQELSAE